MFSKVVRFENIRLEIALVKIRNTGIDATRRKTGGNDLCDERALKHLRQAGFAPMETTVARHGDDSRIRSRINKVRTYRRRSDCRNDRSLRSERKIQVGSVARWRAAYRIGTRIERGENRTDGSPMRSAIERSKDARRADIERGAGRAGSDEGSAPAIVGVVEGVVA